MSTTLDYDEQLQDLQNELDPVIYHLSLLKANAESTKGIIAAIKMINAFNNSKDDAIWTKFPYNDVFKKVLELKEIIDTRYPIEKFPEYWI